MIIVVACGQAKQTGPARAGELYTGPYARAGFAWARSVTPPSNIYVLSALYGLVPHNRVVMPYEKRLDDPDAVTTATLRTQAVELGIANDRHVIVVGGKAYREAARAVWPHATAPFARYGGMGKQIGALRRSTGEVPNL